MIVSWILRRLGRRNSSDDTLDVGRLMREAKPSAPELAEERANRIFATAVAGAGVTRRRRSRPFFMMAAVACGALSVVAAALLIAHRNHGVPPVAESIAPTHKFAGTGDGSGQLPRDGLAVKHHPAYVRRDRWNPRPPQLAWDHRRRRRPGNIKAAAIGDPVAIPQPARLITRHDVEPGTRLTEALVNVSQGIPETRLTGTLIVIYTDLSDAAPAPKLSAIDRSERGYAKVAAYLPVGPGGGILTHCMVRDSGDEEDATVAQYGVVFGEHTLRLTTALDRQNSQPVDDRKGKNP